MHEKRLHSHDTIIMAAMYADVTLTYQMSKDHYQFKTE